MKRTFNFNITVTTTTEKGVEKMEEMVADINSGKFQREMKEEPDIVAVKATGIEITKYGKANKNKEGGK